jgi:hypothetical protein
VNGWAWLVLGFSVAIPAAFVMLLVELVGLVGDYFAGGRDES